MGNSANKKTNNSIITALFWKFSERMGASLTQFVLQIVLARLLTPDLYGTLSLMIIFTTLANVFIQQGFNTALIQNKDVSEEDYSSVLWVSVGIATVLYIVLYAVAPWIASFYNIPEIILPFRVLALMLFPGAFNSVQIAKLSREMDFKKIFWGNLAGIVISGLAGIAIALMGGGLWALVAQTLLNVLIACIVMSVQVRLKVQFQINWLRIKVLFSYGWKLLTSRLIDTLYQDIRSLVIGKKYSTADLGYYDKGKQFPNFLINSLNVAVQSVMLPAMSKEQDEKDKVTVLMRTSMTMLAYVVFPAMAGLAAVAEPLISLLLTDKWLLCVPYLQITCITFAFYPIHSCNLQAINAMGRSDLFLKLEIIKKVYGVIILASVVFLFDSPLAIAISGIFSSIISFFVNAGPNRKLLGYTYAQQIMDILPSMLVALAMFITVRLLGGLNLGSLALLVVQIVAGAAVYVVLSAAFRLKPFLMLLKLIKKTFGRIPKNT